MKIITLSAEMGSYGDEIAAMVAKEMNFHVIDQAEVHRTGAGLR